MKQGKLVGVILLIVIQCGSLLSGCGSTQKSSEQVQDRLVSADEIQMETEQDTEQETDQEVNQKTNEYVQENPISIVDDNYRNYYEIFVSSFYDSDGDGTGDLNGVTEQLDYIADMGFQGIWLMPIMESPTYHKYDVMDYEMIDAAYGTTQDFENLVKACHEKGIRLLIDIVMNHSSSQHEWFQQACEYLATLPEEAEPNLSDCPYVDYYHFTKTKVDETYYQVGNTSWYYEGNFWSEMPDLNLESEAVRTEFAEIADFWIEKGVDGFRMDAAIHFEEANTAFNTEVLDWFYQYCLTKNPDFYMVSEVWANVTTIKDYYTSNTPSFFNFDVANAEGKIAKAARGKWKAEKFVQNMVSYQEDFTSVNSDYIDAPFISNHDTSRAAAIFQSKEEDMKMAAGLLMTMNGSPFVYYGEEIGMPSSGKKDENKRLPMIWSLDDAAGKTNAPKDADEGISSKFGGVKEQQQDRDSILNYYKKALRLRNENPEIARGTITVISELTVENQAVITKTYDNSTIAILYNTSEEMIQINLEKTALAQMQLCGVLSVSNESATLENGIIEIPAKTICYMK